jgi:hypothetical protein
MVAVAISAHRVDLNDNGNADPLPVDVTVPIDCTAVYLFWYWNSTVDAAALASVTLEGVAPDETLDDATDKFATHYGTGLAVWFNPGVGANQTVDLSWTQAPAGESALAIVYVKDGLTTGSRALATAQGDSTDQVSLSIASDITDLVIKHNGNLFATPALSSGWTNIHDERATPNNHYYRNSSADSPGASFTQCDAEDELQACIAAVSIMALPKLLSITAQLEAPRHDGILEATLVGQPVV